MHLTPEQRHKLAEIAECELEDANPAFDRLESVLSDYPLYQETFESPKPNEVRDLIAPKRGRGLQSKLRDLTESLGKVSWQVAAEFKAQGIDFDLTDFRARAEQLEQACDGVVAAWADRKIARRAPQRVRDVHTIPAIADLFDALYYGEDGRRPRNWFYLDAQCEFVSLALKAAGIPSPDAGNTNLSEAGQGRLRRLLKEYAHKRGRMSKGKPTRPPSLTD